jgi:hypothetical protein
MTTINPTPEHRQELRAWAAGLSEPKPLAHDVLALLDHIERLEAALRPFAAVADAGKAGGKFVIAKAIYDDMGGTSGRSAPRQSHWHWDQFEAARLALNQEQEQGNG